MADFKWIDKDERLPTKDDANAAHYVYVVNNGYVEIRAFYTIAHCVSITHWLPFSKMPTPKRYRVATIHDLAVRLKPIPCRVRNCASDRWQPAQLMGYAFWDDAFFADGTWWKFCEICDE